VSHILTFLLNSGSIAFRDFSVNSPSPRPSDYHTTLHTPPPAKSNPRTLKHTSMSNVINDEASLTLLNDLVEDLTDSQLVAHITVASSALILHDWSLTSHEELTFVWRRGKSLYTRILFLSARYTALVSALLYLFPVASKMVNGITALNVVTIVCSEFIFTLRTWAIWERSRLILVFLIGLNTAYAALAITVVEYSNYLAHETPPITWVIEGVGQYQMTIGNTASHALLVSSPFLLILVFQSVVLALTLYRLRYRSHTPAQSRSTLLDILWIDGIMYFVFMFLLGVVNVGLTFKVSRPNLQLGLAQLQTVFHSILSTRVVLHTATVLRKDIVDSRATVPQNRGTNSMRLAEVTIELVPEYVEDQETLR